MLHHCNEVAGHLARSFSPSGNRALIARSGAGGISAFCRLAHWFVSLCLLILAFGASPVLAGPSIQCAPSQSFTVASGATHTIDQSGCSPFGFTGMPVPPSHGNIPNVAGNGDGIVFYTNNGDGATSDTFTIRDDLAGDIVFTVTVLPPTSPITVTPSSLSAPVIGVAYSQTISSTGGVAPYSYTIASGSSLPAGISLTPEGTLSGTVTASGNFIFGVKVTDSTSVTTIKNYSFNVDHAASSMVITPDLLPPAGQHVFYSQQISTSGGTAPYTYVVESGTLAPGLTISNTGLISGTPSTVGSYSFVILSTDATSGGGPYKKSIPYTLNVAAQLPPTITSVSPATGLSTGGTAVTITGTGFTGVTALKFGIANGISVTVINSTTITASSPAGSAGVVNVTVTASGGTSAASAGNQFTYIAAPTVSSISPTSGAASGGTTVTITGANLSGATAVSFGGTAATGFTVNSATSITATAPAGTGTVDVRVTTTGGTSATSAADQFSYVAAPTVSSISPTGGPAMGGTTVIITGTNLSGATAVTFGATAATGYTINSATQITATAPAGTGTVDVRVTTTGGTSATSAADQFTYVGAPTVSSISPASGAASGGTTVIITGTNLSGATAVTFGATAATGYTINSATQITATAPAGTGTVDVRVTTTGGTSATSAADQFSYQTKPIASNSTASVAYGSSANPINLTLSGSAATSVAVVTAAIHGTATVSGTTISYTPTAGYAGSDSFGYTASNGNGTSAQATVTITVSVPSVSLTPATLSNPAVGTPYSATITAAGGAAPYTYSVSSGSLPAGLSLNASTGVLSGTATVAGSFTFSLRGSDSSTGASAPFITSNSYTVTIAAPTITVTPVSLPAGTAATAYSQQLTGNGGVAPYVFTVKSGSLPAGLTLSSSGLLSGTPTAAGSFMLTVQAQDVHLFTGTRSYTLVVSSATVSLTPTSLPNPVGGAAYSVTLSADGGTGPYAYSVSSGSLPAGLSLNTATGLLSGTTTAVGSSTFSLMATDSSTGVGAPFRATNSYTLTVNAPTIVVAPTALAAMTTGSAYSQVITASGGTAPYSYAVTAGALPPGMNLAVGGTLSGTPTTAGAYSFTVTATDSSAFKGVFLYSGTVKANPPVTVADTATTNANTMVAVPVTSNDTGAITSIAIVTPPSHGTAKVTALNVEYTPASNFFGVDTLTYTATGPGGISAAATVTITVTPLAVPVAKPQQLKVLAGQSVMLNAVLGATGGPFTAVTLVTAPAKGKTIVSGTDITFTPDADGSGDVTLVYTVSNVFGASPPVTSTITVNPVPVAPALSANAAAGTQVDIDLTATATGGPFTGSAVLAVTPINAGVATIRSVAAASGSAGAGYVMTFKASATYSGTAVIGYTLSNAFASSPAGQVSVSVAARRDVSTDAEVAGLLAAQANTARRFASAQIGNFTRRLESLHGDGWGRSDFGLTLSTGNNRAMSDAAMSGYAGEDRIVGMDPRNGLSRNGMRKVGWKPDSQGAGNAGQGVYLSDRGADTQGPDLPGNDQPQGVQKQALAFWIGGAVDYGRQNLRGVDTQYRFTTSGISAGGDYRINDLATLGVGVGFSKDSSRIGVNGSKSSADSASAVIYGSLRPAKGVFIDGLLGYGSLSFDSTRYITDGGGTATGTRKGSQFFGSVIAGMEFYGSSWMWSPYGRLEMSQATLDTFTESAQGIQALTYFKQKVRSTNGVLGIRGEGMYSTAWGKLMPRARIEYTRRFQGDDEARMAYADLADLGPAYVLRTRGSDVGIWTVGLGGRLMLQSGVELSLEINSSLDTSNTRYRALSLGVRAPF